jgi:hypothetical protein
VIVEGVVSLLHALQSKQIMWEKCLLSREEVSLGAMGKGESGI